MKITKNDIPTRINAPLCHPRIGQDCSDSARSAASRIGPMVIDVSTNRFERAFQGAPAQG